MEMNNAINAICNNALRDAMENGTSVYKKYLSFYNEEVCKQIIRADISAFKFIPPEYMTKEMCLFACKSHCAAYIYIPAHLRLDDDILCAVLSQWGGMLEYCPLIVKSNKKYVEMAAKNDISALQFADCDVLKDRELAKSIVSKNAIAIKYFPYFKNDTEVCKDILNINPDFAKYVGEKVWDEHKRSFLRMNYFEV